MSEKRKRYSPAEKAKIALEAIKSELTLAQITAKYRIYSTQVNTWKKQALAYLPERLVNYFVSEVKNQPFVSFLF